MDQYSIQHHYNFPSHNQSQAARELANSSSTIRPRFTDCKPFAHFILESLIQCPNIVRPTRFVTFAAPDAKVNARSAQREKHTPLHKCMQHTKPNPNQKRTKPTKCAPLTFDKYTNSLRTRYRRHRRRRHRHQHRHHRWP